MQNHPASWGTHLCDSLEKAWKCKLLSFDSIAIGIEAWNYNCLIESVSFVDKEIVQSLQVFLFLYIIIIQVAS